VARSVIHASSSQVYELSTTTLAVAGGSSLAERHRVGLLPPLPVPAEDLELVAAAGPMPGTKISQTPVAPRLRIACPRPTQWLNSPTTRTARAFGAQTAKLVPVTSPSVSKAREPG
jgi:hypothetical protein